MHKTNVTGMGITRARPSRWLIQAASALLLLTGCSRNARHSNPSGTLEATEVDISAVVSARVTEVRVGLGDRVTASDTLVVLDTEVLALQRRQTELGRLSIAAQRRVAGDNMAQARRNLELLETSLQRTAALVEQGSAMRQQLDELQARRDVAASQVEAAGHQLEALEAEETKLEAALKVLDRQLAEGVLTATMDGIVILRAVEPGEVVLPGAVCVRIADLSRMELRVFLGAEDLDLVSEGTKLPVRVDALEGKILEGSVSWISPEAEFTPKNVQTRDARAQLVYALKIAIENPGGRLHIGMPAEAMLGSPLTIKRMADGP